jgi:hypothetical protein
VLDAAGYGAVTITKGSSIVNDGVGVAGIQTVPGVNGVTINAGANDSVHLRGLLIEGLGVGTNGILFNTGRNLAIEYCVIRNFGTAGINIASSTSSKFSVSNTISSDSPGNGITIPPTGAAAVTAVLSKVAANNNGLGFLVIGASTTGALNVTIVDSEASNNFVSGVGAFRPPPCCAISLPATTLSDLARTRMPSFGSRIRWLRGTILESTRSAAALQIATATTTSTGTQTTTPAL